MESQISSLNLSLTGKCNLHCIYCPTERAKSMQTNMNLQTLFSLINKLSPFESQIKRIEVLQIKKILTGSILLFLIVLFIIPLSFSSDSFQFNTDFNKKAISPESSVYTFGLTNNAQYTINDTIYQNWNYQGWKSFNDKTGLTWAAEPNEEYAAGTSAACGYSEGTTSHMKCAYILDSSTSTNNCQWNLTWNPIQVGTVEFYIRFSDYDGVIFFRLADAEYSESQDHRRVDMYSWPTLGMRSSKDGYADATLSYTLGTWYHIRCDFDTNADTFSLYRDGSLWDSGGLNGDSDGISKLTIGSYGAYQGAAWFDAIDISTAEGYYPRRNQVINSSQSIMSLYYPVYQMASMALTTWNLYVTPNAYNSITGITDGTALIHFIQNLTTNTLLDVRFSSGSISSLTFNGPTNDIELYSESDQNTRWDFDQPTIIYSENFTGLTINDSTIMYIGGSSEFGSVLDIQPNDNLFGVGYIGTFNPIWNYYTWLKNSDPFLTYFPDYVINSTFLVNNPGFQSNSPFTPSTTLPFSIGVYATNTTIDYTTLTWNNQPSPTYKTSKTVSSYGAQTIVAFTESQKNIQLRYAGAGDNAIQLYTPGFYDWIWRNITIPNTSYSLIPGYSYNGYTYTFLSSTSLTRTRSLSLLTNDIIEFTVENQNEKAQILHIGSEDFQFSGIGTNIFQYILRNDQSISNFSFDINFDFGQFKLTSFNIYRGQNNLSASYYVAPFSQKDCWVKNGTYLVKIYENNILTQVQFKTIRILSTERIFYEKTGDLQCRITIFDQRSNVIDLNKFHIKIQRVLLKETEIFWLYASDFYADLDSNVTIWIYDRFNILQYDETVSAVNFIDIQLDVFSLKVKNMCEKFNFVNVTRDPNYYPTDTQYWSEWIAPGEIIEYRLFPDFYRITITNNENSSTQMYAYTFVADDILLIESENTILNVINNIQNTNTTLGNQITNVEINITNQNSQINNTIVNIEVNLSNVNSTLGNLLVNIESTVTALGNNISTLYIFTNNSFYALNNSIQTSFTELTSTVYLINNSIFTAVQSLSMELNNINNTIMGNLSLVLRQNEYLTQIYQYCIFSDFLDWSNASRNQSFITDQIAMVQVKNQFYNTSAQLYLRYANQTETLLYLAQETKDNLMLPKDAEYRVKSLKNGSYLSDWQPIPANKTINFGYDEREYIEAPISETGVTVVDVILSIVVTISFAGIFVYFVKRISTTGIKRITRKYETKKEREPNTKNPIDSIRGRNHEK